MNELKHLRNTLWTSKFSKHDQKMMESVIEIISSSESPFKEMILFALHNSKEDIENSQFKIAAKELSLVHELPVDVDDIEDWDDSWFYKNQLGEYFDKNKNIERVKKVVDLLSIAQKGMAD